MLFALLALLVGACDPPWRVESIATARPPTHVHPACIDAALVATRNRVTRGPLFDGYPREWGFGYYGLQLSWDPTKPTVVQLWRSGVGAGSVERLRDFRTERDRVLRALTQACGPLEPRVTERCVRMDC